MYVKYQMYHPQRVLLSTGPPRFRFARENPLCTHSWGRTERFPNPEEVKGRGVFQTLFCIGSIFWQAGKDTINCFNNCRGLVLFGSSHSPSSPNQPEKKPQTATSAHFNIIFSHIFSLGGVQNHRAIYSSRRDRGQPWLRVAHQIFKRRQKVEILLRYFAETKIDYRENVKNWI